MSARVLESDVRRFRSRATSAFTASDASTARRTPPRSASRAPAASFLSIGWILAWIGATPSNDGGHYAKKKGGEAAASPPMSRSDQTSVRGIGGEAAASPPFFLA